MGAVLSRVIQGPHGQRQFAGGVAALAKSEQGVNGQIGWALRRGLGA
jgi:hypothetical protein